jgi:adenylate cyclase
VNRRRSHTLLLLIAALGAIGAGVALRVSNALNAQEQQTVDTRFAVRGAQKPPRDLLIVAIDDATFSDLTQRGLRSQWPFPRRYHAHVIDTLRREGARVIAVDIQFTEPTTAEDDNALIGAVAAARGSVLGTTEVDAQGHTNIFGGDRVLRQIGARAGNASVPVDATGEIRRLPTQIHGLDTFGWAVARQADPGLRAPPQAPMWIDYAGPAGTVPTVSYSRVYDGLIPASEVRGKIVIVGPTSPSLQDVHPTPTSGVMPGVEVQANAVESFLRRGPLRSTPLGIDLLIIAALGALAPLATLRLRSGIAPLVPIVAGVVYVGASQLLFDAGWIVPVTTPVAALIVGLVAALAIERITTAFERRRVYDLFSRFVPDTVVKEVVAQSDGARLGGVARVCTVMFADLRGFTSFSSNHEPQLVIDVVNAYLGEMSEAILEAGGTLVAYLGDGILAVFGAPLEQRDHADRALAAALEMLGRRLPRFNALLRSMGQAAQFDMGIGLNSGPVISGNVGSERRLEYTTIGDTTNLASRIEGATKDTPYMLLFSESTRQSLTHPPASMLLGDEIDLRGANRPLKLWTVPGTQKPDRPAGEAAGPTDGETAGPPAGEAAGRPDGEAAGVVATVAGNASSLS